MHIHMHIMHIHPGIIFPCLRDFLFSVFSLGQKISCMVLVGGSWSVHGPHGIQDSEVRLKTFLLQR